MKLGFDLDKIFVDYPPIVPSKLIDMLYKEKDDGTLVYRIPGKIEQEIRKLSHLPLFRPPIKKNILFLKTLSENDKHSLFLISSRFGFLKKQTERLAKRLGFDGFFSKMYFNFLNQQPHMFKDTVLKKLSLDSYIDDDLSLLRYLAQRHPRTRFFWLNSNQKKKISSNLFAVTSIEDILTQAV